MKTLGSRPPIRNMAAGDLDRVMQIAGELETAPHWPLTAYESAIDPEARPRRIALVAESTEGIAGFLVASVAPPEAELETIAVASAAQRRGLGRALLAELVAQLQAANAMALDLEVRASNRAALELYQRAAFAEVARRPGYYRDPIEDAVLLRLIF